MRIVVVNAQDNRGGAAKAALRLSHAYRELGHDVVYYVNKKTLDEDWIVESSSNFVSKKIRQIFDRVPGILAQFDINVSYASGLFGQNIDEIKELKPDVVHIHWINKGFISVKGVTELAEEFPVIWTHHDEWIVGDGFTAVSFRDNVLKNIPPKTKIQQGLLEWVDRKRIASIEGKSFAHSCPSHYLTKQVAKRFNGNQVLTIPNCIDSRTFQKMDRSELWNKYDIEPGKYILLGAVNPDSNPIKGFDLIKKSLASITEYLEDNNVGVIAFGGQNPFIRLELSSNIKQKFLGYITNEDDLAEIFNIASVMCVPSRMENAPFLVAEPHMCGLPVVAYSVGGITEMVNEVNGKLVSPYDTEAYGMAIKDVLEGEYDSTLISRNSSNEYDSITNAQKYVDCFESMID